MSAKVRNTSAGQPLFAGLEASFIEEFLRERGFGDLELQMLPVPEREALLKQASADASARLAEIESRSHLRDELHESEEAREQSLAFHVTAGRRRNGAGRRKR